MLPPPVQWATTHCEASAGRRSHATAARRAAAGTAGNIHRAVGIDAGIAEHEIAAHRGEIGIIAHVLPEAVDDQVAPLRRSQQLASVERTQRELNRTKSWKCSSAATPGTPSSCGSRMASMTTAEIAEPVKEIIRIGIVSTHAPARR